MNFEEKPMKIFNRFKKLNAEWRAARELSLMSDAALQDIGISRSHIPYVVKNSNR